MLSAITEDRSKDAWIAVAWEHWWEAPDPTECIAMHRTQEKASMQNI